MKKYRIKKNVNFVDYSGTKNYHRYMHFKDLYIKNNRTFCDVFFNVNFPNDPCEVILKAKKINNYLPSITPQIVGLKKYMDEIWFVCEYESNVHRRQCFKSDDYKRLGEFVGKMHSFHFDCFGNLYNFNLNNHNFGERFCDCFKKVVKESNKKPVFNEDIIKEFYKYETEIKELFVEHSTFVMINPQISDYIFSENDAIKGYYSVEKIVLAFPELELISWKRLLKKDFTSFLEGYSMCSTTELKFDDINFFIYKIMNCIC